MKCLVPLMTKSPPRCTALVFIPRRSEPACGSLMARHSTRSPRTLKPLRCTAGKRIASLAIATLAALAALAATGLALISSNDFINRFGDFLALLLYLFTPWTAINLVDFYIVPKGHYSIREIFNPNDMYGRWNWRALTADMGLDP
jgi:fatty acid desaturase